MSKTDPFGFDLSVSAAKKKNPRGRRGMSGASETSTRICHHEGCNEPGKFRAPKATCWTNIFGSVRSMCASTT